MSFNRSFCFCRCSRFNRVYNDCDFTTLRQVPHLRTDDLVCGVISPAGWRHQRDAHRKCSPRYDDRHVDPARPSRPVQVLGVAKTSHRGFFVQPSAQRRTLRPQHRIRKGTYDPISRCLTTSLISSVPGCHSSTLVERDEGQSNFYPARECGDFAILSVGTMYDSMASVSRVRGQMVLLRQRTLPIPPPPHTHT